MIMYGAVIPSYKAPDKNGKKKTRHERIDADDKTNKDKLKSILYG